MTGQVETATHRLQGLEEPGREAVVQPSKGAVPRQKRYLDEQEGRPVDTIWVDITPGQLAGSGQPEPG